MGVVTRLASRAAQRQQLMYHQPRVMVSVASYPAVLPRVNTGLQLHWHLFPLSGSSTRGASFELIYPRRIL